MLPWEHAAAAYLLYSGYSHLRYDEVPGGGAVLVLLFASQLPDLIDKPLAWGIGVLPSGRSLGHSVFVGLPLAAGVVELARRRGTPKGGYAFAIGHLAHLATDAVPLYPGAGTSFGIVLWPLVAPEPEPPSPGGLLERTVEILVGNASSLVTLDPSPSALAGTALVLVALVVWIHDGTPGIRETITLVRRPVTGIREARSR